MRFVMTLAVSFAVKIAAVAQVPPPAPAAPPQVAVLQVLGGLVAAKVAGKDVAKKKEKTDAEVLQAVGIKADDPAALVGYFKTRTLTDVQMTAITAAIKRMGDEKYREREKASADVVTFGAAALGPLKAAVAQNDDPEIVYRAEEARKKIETVSQSSVAVAAAKRLAVLKPADAAATLLAFLPAADNELVADELRRTLVALATRDGKPAPAVLAALTDANATRRSAAAVALAEGARTPDAIAAVKAMVAKEADVEAKYASVMALVISAKDADSVGTLIGLIPDVGRGRVWQTEDLLLQLAGEKAPKAAYAKSKQSLEAYRDAWSKWWVGARAGTDLATFKYAPRTDGTVLLVEWNPQGWGQGHVTVLGPNLKERVRLTGLGQPLDAVALPGQRIAVLEQTQNRVTIRNYANEILSNFQIPQPMGMQLLPNGKLFVSARNGAAEYDLDGKKGWSYDRPNNNHDVMIARRLPNGETIFFCNSDQKNNCVRVGADGKEVGKPFALGQPYYQPAVEGASADEFFVTDYNKINKYSLKDNKAVWSHPANGVTCLQKLPNGNLLYVTQNTNKIVEVTPNKDEVWEYQMTSGMRLARAYRQ